MKKPKRCELIKLIIVKAGLAPEAKTQAYLTRKQLLDLNSYLDVKEINYYGRSKKNS